MVSVQYHDEHDLRLAKAGDKDALSRLLLRFGPQIRYGLEINCKWQAVLDLDDVMQVTYLEAFMSISKFESSANAFPSWLQQIAVNNLCDVVEYLSRRKRPQPDQRLKPAAHQDSVLWLYEILSGGTTPSKRMSREEIHSVLRCEVERLPQDYAHVLRLIYFEGEPYARAAELMSRTLGAVHLLRMRATDHLRRRLGANRSWFFD